MERLETGVPAGVGAGGDNVKKIAETVQHFITAMDSLKLNMVAVDELYPLLSDIYAGLSSITKIPPDFEGTQKIGQDPSALKYGISITDECISWETTEKLILSAADK